jgi:hypothetical protein
MVCSILLSFFGASFPAGGAVAGAAPPRAGAGAFPRAVAQSEATDPIGGWSEAVSPGAHSSAIGPMGPRSY